MRALREKQSVSFLEPINGWAWAGALALHVAIMWLAWRSTEPPEPFQIPAHIGVDLIEIPERTAEPEEAPGPGPEARPVIPELVPRPKPKPDPGAERPSDSDPVKQGPIDHMPSTGTDLANIDHAVSAPRSKIPSRWVLEPPLAEKRLEGLGLLKEDIDCLRALSEDCKDLRRDVFAEYRLSETELVWTPERADTGLPSQFYGLSEAEILERLNVNIAGQNGLSLPIIGTVIDGQLWDSLHGVKKHCKIVRSLDAPMGIKKVCPETLPKP